MTFVLVSEDDKYQQFVIDVGSKIKESRQKKSLTMRAVADQLNMDENNYGRFERGLTNPTLKSLYRICEVLEIDIKELF